jgi:hypothetical protein
MVLRPVYHPQEDEQNMQYPYRATERLDQGTWQTPYGAEYQTTAHDSNCVLPQGPPAQYDQTQFATPYAAPNGENTTYYENTPQHPAYDTNWQNQDQPVHGQQQYNYAPAYEATPSNPQNGPYSHGNTPVPPYQAQDSYKVEPHFSEPEVKQEEQLYARMQQSSPYPDTTYSAPPGIRDEQGYQSIPGQAPPSSSNHGLEQDRGVMGAIAGAAAGGYAG